MRTKTLWIRQAYLHAIRQGPKTVEVCVAYRNIARLAVGDLLLLNDVHRDAIRRIRRYATFEELLAGEDVAAIAPDIPPGDLLVALREIYPPEKEAMAVIALEVEPGGPVGLAGSRPGLPSFKNTVG